jgi:CRISPR-associated protein Cmr2
MNIPLEIREQYNYLHNDSQLFYEENLNKNYFEKNDIEYPLDDCLKEFQGFKKAIKKEYKQTSYYAVVMFDGDDMGKWLSGQRLNDKSKLKEFHKDISLNLATFANKARDILKEPKGMTVYAGGEDFLGFVNLDNLFDVLVELNSQFRELIGEPLKEKYQLNDDFTFSAGAVIAHYKTPLGTVLNEARKSEKKAKKSSGKDAVCLTVLKRSGEVRETILKFESFFELDYITKQLNKNFSSKFISNLEKEFLLMCDENGELDNSLNSMLYSEIKRTLHRSLKIESAKDNITSMVDSIRRVHTVNFRNFADGLYICRFIDKEIE